jgi:hypothetical protein
LWLNATCERRRHQRRNDRASGGKAHARKHAFEPADHSFTSSQRPALKRMVALQARSAGGLHARVCREWWGHHCVSYADWRHAVCRAVRSAVHVCCPISVNWKIACRSLARFASRGTDGQSWRAASRHLLAPSHMIAPKRHHLIDESAARPHQHTRTNKIGALLSDRYHSVIHVRLRIRFMNPDGRDSTRPRVAPSEPRSRCAPAASDYARARPSAAPLPWARS